MIFPDHPDFLPLLTPRQCLERGVFGGCYFNAQGGKAGVFGREVAVSHQEFPTAWFEDVPEHLYVSRRYVCSTNHYGVKSGFGQKEWESKGWIHVQVYFLEHQLYSGCIHGVRVLILLRICHFVCTRAGPEGLVPVVLQILLRPALARRRAPDRAVGSVCVAAWALAESALWRRCQGLRQAR